MIYLILLIELSIFICTELSKPPEIIGRNEAVKRILKEKE